MYVIKKRHKLNNIYYKMLKSIILIPSNDIMSYCDHPEYPFNIFPHLIIRYKKNIIKLDNRDLSLLYHLNTKNYDEECNKNESCFIY